jgi:hypothetical protein
MYVWNMLGVLIVVSLRKIAFCVGGIPGRCGACPRGGRGAMGLVEDPVGSAPEAPVNVM